MDKLRLFREDDERYTPRAEQLDREAGEALRPILERVFAEGYGTRDVEALLLWTIGEMCVTRRLDVRAQVQPISQEAV